MSASTPPVLPGHAVGPGIEPPAADPSAPASPLLAPRRLVSASAWMTGAHVVAQILAYASLVVLARLVPPESFGTVAAGTAIVWLAVAVIDSGTHGGIVVSSRLTRSFLRRAFRRSLFLALVLAAAMALGAEALVGSVARSGDAAALAVLALSLPLYAVVLIPTAILHRAMAFARLAGATAAANIGSAGVAVIAGFAGAGVWALVTRQLVWFAALALLAAILVRPYLPGTSAPADAAEPRGARRDRWFLLFGVTLLVALNVDYLVIGGLRDVSAVGLYAMAFMIAFAPVEHFSAEVGKVLFAAAAASNRELSGVRTLHAVRVMSALLLPLLPVGVVLAPSLLPSLLGEEWSDMVVPFQLLLVVGVGHAILNCVGEALSGIGEIAFRAKVNMAWCAATLLALLVLVEVDGIRGAALAHLAVFVPYAAIYVTTGARRAGSSTSALWRAVRPVLAAVAAQAAVTVGAVVTLAFAGASDGLAASFAALAGLAVLAAVLMRGPSPGREGVALLWQALRGRA